MYKVKRNPDGTIAKHQARFVARSFLQKEGLDFIEVFAPVARLENSENCCCFGKLQELANVSLMSSQHS